MQRLFRSVTVSLFVVSVASAAGPRILGSLYRADEPRPEFTPYWLEDAKARIPSAAELQKTLGGSVHMFLRNDSGSPLTMEDLRFERFSLTKVLVFSDQRKDRKPASIYYANLPSADLQKLESLGEPVWWKCDPPVIPPGEVAEVAVRLRGKPESPKLNLDLVFSGGSLPFVVGVGADQPRLDGLYYSADRRQVFGYFRRPGRAGAAPVKFLFDGQDVTASATVGKDNAIEIVPVVVQLTRELAEGSLHCLQGVYADGAVASGATRVIVDDFGYGVWGGMQGKEGDTEKAKATLRDLAEKNVNLQMPQVGSAMLGSFYNSEEGRAFCRSLGINFVTSGPGKWRIHDPHAYFLKDEPDWADTRMKGLPRGHEVGAIAQYIVGTAYDMRKEDPATPTLLNVNLGYKPLQWYTYGQLPDIFASDPYYQVRLWESYGAHPQRREAYAKAEWIYAVSSISQTAGAPRPLHIILYSCRRGEGRVEEDPEDGPAKKRTPSTMHRWATPPEKRLEAYYAIAGGAKGISYWWFSPTGGQSQGMGSDHPQAKALWREVGLIGAELRTAGPVLLCSAPADLPLKPTPGVFARALVAGTETVVVVAANDRHRNTDKGTDIQPIENARIALDVPSWLKPRHVFAIDTGGIQDIRTSGRGDSLTIPLGTLDVTRMVIVTSDETLRERLSGLYKEKFAANVAKLTGKTDGVSAVPALR